MLVVVVKVVVNPGHVEAKLADVLGFEPAYFELDYTEAGLHPVEEQQVDIETPRGSRWRTFTRRGSSHARHHHASNPIDDLEVFPCQAI
ncbi:MULTISPECIES: hypothetical protein [Rhodococcus]|jgi:hypothetical protein|uniref:hypothetical protein n=1 Tax=Rhodococcus TaxID=1827 RepID=UPI001ED8DF27|nr:MULTISPECIES: hypothetical protein [Rhodococcus]MDH6288045.1 hypothetical protein [Rhodococcus opacus]